MLSASAITYRMHHELTAQSRTAKVAAALASITDLAAGVSAVTLGIIMMVGLLALGPALQWSLLAAGAAYTVLSLVTTVPGRYNLRALLNAHQEKQRALTREQTERDRGDRVLLAGVREIGKLETDNQRILRAANGRAGNLQAQIRRLNGELEVTSSDKASALAIARGLRRVNTSHQKKINRLEAENHKLATDREYFLNEAAALEFALTLAPETVRRLIEVWDKPEPVSLFGGLLEL